MGFGSVHVLLLKKKKTGRIPRRVRGVSLLMKSSFCETNVKRNVKISIQAESDMMVTCGNPGSLIPLTRTRARLTNFDCGQGVHVYYFD